MKAKKKRNKKIMEMREAGFSYNIIGNAMGINRKTVWGIVNGYPNKGKKR